MLTSKAVLTSSAILPPRFFKSIDESEQLCPVMKMFNICLPVDLLRIVLIREWASAGRALALFVAVLNFILVPYMTL